MAANGPWHPRDQINFNAVRSADCLRELSARCRLPPARLFGLLVDAHAASAVGDDVEESTRHHQILVEIYHVSLIADRQMHAKGGAEAEQNEQGSSPPCLEAGKERQAAEEMDGDGDPDGHVRNRHMDAREILGRADGVPEL